LGVKDEILYIRQTKEQQASLLHGYLLSLFSASSFGLALGYTFTANTVFLMKHYTNTFSKIQNFQKEYL